MGPAARDRLVRPLVCLVTDRHRVAPDARTDADEEAALEALIDEAMDEGIGLVQLREPDMGPRAQAELVRRIVRRRGSAPTRVLVNDRADVAWVSSADGVHLREVSPPADRILELRTAWIVGRSIHTSESQGLREALDYTLFGTVFPSASKPPGHRVGGLDGLSKAVAASRAPVVAIGGIRTPELAAACVRAGAIGVAAIGLFLPEGTAPWALGARRAVRELSAVMSAAR